MIECDAIQFLSFIKSGIRLREYSKFNFSKHLSDILSLIILVGKEAQKMEKKVNLEKYRVIKSIHPSPINKKFARTDWENIPSIWARAI